MFISVKNLTDLLDQDLTFYKEGMESKENHSKEEFEKWQLCITNSINKKLEKLKQISCNKKLIAKYEDKINKITEAYK